MPKKNNSSTALVEIRQSADLAENRFDYNGLDLDRRQKLQELKTEIYNTLRRTLESILHLGQCFHEAKEILDTKQYKQWIEDEFTNGPLGISKDTCNNWLNTYRTWQSHPEAHDAMEALSTTSMRVLYRVCAPIQEEVRQAVFAMAREGSKLTVEDVRALKELTRTYNLSQSGVTPQAQQLLLTADSDVAENPEELKRMAALRKHLQPEVAKVIVEGKAETVNAAKRLVLDRILEQEEEDGDEILEAEIIETEAALPEPTLKTYKGDWVKALSKVPENSVDLLIAECPLRYDFLTKPDGLDKLSALADRVLVEGGFLVATLGHKAILGCEPHVSPLEALHVLTLRRMPGHSRSIVGINITSASVHCVLAYKPPFRPPERMLVDLQTYGEDPLPGMDEVPSGIEKGFDQIIRSLVCQGETVAHVICTNQHYKMREALKQSAINAECGAFYSVG